MCKLQMGQLQICQLQMYQRCFENIKNCKCGTANEANCKLLNGKVENGKNGVANEELQIRNCKYGCTVNAGWIGEGERLCYCFPQGRHSKYYLVKWQASFAFFH